jgi:hypothetical protein
VVVTANSLLACPKYFSFYAVAPSIIAIFYNGNDIPSGDIGKMISNSNRKTMPALKLKKQMLTAVADNKAKIMAHVNKHCLSNKHLPEGQPQ